MTLDEANIELTKHSSIVGKRYLDNNTEEEVVIKRIGIEKISQGYAVYVYFKGLSEEEESFTMIENLKTYTLLS